MKTEQALTIAFDFQRIERNPRLQRLIDLAQSDFMQPLELNEEDTEIWAAGDAERSFHDPNEKRYD